MQLMFSLSASTCSLVNIFPGTLCLTNTPLYYIGKISPSFSVKVKQGLAPFRCQNCRLMSSSLI